MPPFTPASHVDPHLREYGYAVLDPYSVCKWIDCELEALLRWNFFWSSLPLDRYLVDGGRYRRRRHSCFVVEGDQVLPSAPRAHWQPREYNALHGGMYRWFEPLSEGVIGTSTWSTLIRRLGTTASTIKAEDRWFVEAHQFRIDTTEGAGYPTPEGLHRDGVDLVAVFLVGREQVQGGESRVFEAQNHQGLRFTLTEPWSLLLLDDRRMVHESTAVQALGGGGFRDTLVVTLRSGGFLGT
nr:2OG-Fe dioxygenase family protein [Nitrosomonas nitrosa]